MDIARLTRRMIVASPAADSVRITARVDDQRWDVALMAMLKAHGLDGIEDTLGVIAIRTAAEFAAADAASPLATRIVILSRDPATIAAVVRRRLSAAGAIDVDTALKALIVTERASLVDQIVSFIRTLDTLPRQRPPQ